MEHDHLTPEQIERRLLDRLRRPELKTRYESASPSTGFSMISTRLILSEVSLFRRIRHKMVVDILPIFKLASHNSLLRAYRALDEANNAIKQLTRERDDATNVVKQLTSERDEILNLLRTIAPDRDRLAGELQRAQTNVHDLLDELNQLKMGVNRTTERDQLLNELHFLAAERDMIAADRDRLFQTYQEFKAETETLTTDMALLKVSLTEAKNSLARLEFNVGNLAGNSIAEERTTANRNVAHLIEKIHSTLLTPDAMLDVQELLKTHYLDENDPNLDHLIGFYHDARTEGVSSWDIRVIVRILTTLLQPRTYLEVGVRRGWSLAQVFDVAPGIHAYAFDMWVPDYADMENGNPDYLLSKMQSIVGDKKAVHIDFISGDSHSTIPRFFANELPVSTRKVSQEIDIITVDGDHSLLGAFWDLHDLFPHVSLGGAIIFDDLGYAGDDFEPVSPYTRPQLPENIHSLSDVWFHMLKIYPNFIFLTPNFGSRSQKPRPECGIAIRLK